MTRADETIRRVNSIIQALHIPLEVKKTDIYKNKIFSLVLYDKEYPDAFSSGCGFSYTEAMACALGEFIERLQNGLLYDEFHFCQSITAFEKNIVMNIPSCSINKKFLLFPSSNKTVCYKYKNIFNNKIEYIPVAYIKQNCGSSGMAAGVSLEEAIQNGLKEVVERYICKMIYTKKVSKLTMGYYNYDKFIARENKGLITELKNDGFSLQIIDLSLNFRFPVLGIFLFNNLLKFSFGIGIGNTIDKAIRDALIQILRGKNTKEDIINDMRSFWEIDYEKASFGEKNAYLYEHNLLRHYSSGIIPKDLLLYAMRYPCNLSDENFSTMYNNMIKSCQSLGWQILVKTSLSAGFPSCHIYVPDISEISLNKSKNVINYTKLRHEIKKFAYKQDNSEKLLNILLQSFSKKQFFSSLFEVCYPEYHYAITEGLPLFVELIDTLLIRVLNKTPPNGKKRSKSYATSTVIKEYTLLFPFCTSINIDRQINRIVEMLKILPNRNNCDICLIREQCKINIIKNRLDKWFNLIYSGLQGGTDYEL